MLLSLAYKNIWRNRLRSFVVIGAVGLGIWSLVFMIAFVRGIVYSYIDLSIMHETSHIQLHHPEFKAEREIKYVIPAAKPFLDELNADPQIRQVSARLLTNVMINSSKETRGLILKGVDPEAERRISRLDQKLVEGTFLTGEGRNPIVISRKVADKLKVRLRSKVVATFQDINGDITSAAFRICGIYHTNNRRLDELNAFIRYSDLVRLSGVPEGTVHEIALILEDFEALDEMQGTLSAAHPNLLVESYKQISPDLELFQTQLRLNLIIMTTIVMLALIFGIINTMLMAVLERIKELGMLMAIGMNKLRVFILIVLETVLVALVGAPIGMLLGYCTVRWLNRVGIDLSRWSEGLSEFGVSSIVRPVLETDVYLTIALAITLTALLASIYPSLKATKLKPVEALRKI